jgi:glucokinase
MYMYYLGIEIGGTKLQLGVGRGDGVLAGLWREPVVVADGPEGIRRQITRAVPELLAKSGIDRSQLQGVGIGFGGPVDDNTHTVIKSHQIEGWDNFPLADWIGDVVKLPAVLGNDADCAGLAEALFGAGKGLTPIFYITIGSGIGGGLIINGEVYRGGGRGAAEIGHLLTLPSRALARVLTEATMFHDFQYVPLEEVASGWAIGRRGTLEALSRAIVPTPQKTILSELTTEGRDISAAEVAEAAEKGDAVAKSILDMAWACLAQAISEIILLLNPRRIVIGGGVSLMRESLFLVPLREMVSVQVFKPFVDCYDIVPAGLGEEVVVHGALTVARRRFSQS